MTLTSKAPLFPKVVNVMNRDNQIQAILYQLRPYFLIIHLNTIIAQPIRSKTIIVKPFLIGVKSHYIAT
jgi:cytochrome b